MDEPREVPRSVLERVADGDESAARECIRRYGPLVHAMARRLCPDEVDDAVQDAFVEIWKSAHRFRHASGSEHVFIMTVTRHRLVDRRRASKRRGPPLTVPETVPSSAVPADVVADLERCRRAIGRLDPAPQSAILLACEGCTHEEIAEATGQPLGTVKSNVRRGLAAVRRALLGDSE